MTGFNVHSHVRDIAPHAPCEYGARRTGEGFVECQEVRMSRGQYIENHPSPQSSPICEGVSNSHSELVLGSHRMQQHTGQSDVPKKLKQVQHGANSLKRTYSPRKRAAFTLAEVLITLGVIGIVAAMTMPVLIGNYQKKVWVNQLKKTISSLEQGFQMMMAEAGVDKLTDIPEWGLSVGHDDWTSDYPDAIEFKKYFDRYFKVTYINKLYTVVRPNNTISRNSKVDLLIFSDGSMIYEMHIDPINTRNCQDVYADGGHMCVVVAQVPIDVNGLKGPNKWGRDVHMFYLSEYGKLYASGSKDTAISDVYDDTYWRDDPSLCGSPDDSSGYKNSSGNCAARIIENGWVMDY